MPPSTSLFGRPGQGVSLQSGQTATSGREVVCTNPAALSGGIGDLNPYFSPQPRQHVHTLWVTYPDLYHSRCEHAGRATWLQVTVVDRAGRPIVHKTLGPDWGLHLDDVNLALGNLTTDIAAQEHTFGHN